MNTSAIISDVPVPKGNKKVIQGWVIYDWSNSVYQLTIGSTIFPVYYNTRTTLPSRATTQTVQQVMVVEPVHVAALRELRIGVLWIFTKTIFTIERLYLSIAGYCRRTFQKVVPTGAESKTTNLATGATEMKCQQVQEYIDNLLVTGGNLSLPTVVAEHAAGCRCCQHDYDIARRVLAQIQPSQTLTASPRLKEKIMSQLHKLNEMSAALPKKSTHLWLRLALAGAKRAFLLKGPSGKVSSILK